mmetsp:Transcript_26185/g.69742  ORF Transcript_26185/g.69742 Transcript_26185/m.69742 type:complete len:318 (+) Transcript_26185:1168-2121(+)
MLLDLVQELRHPGAMDAAHRHRFAEPELVELGGLGVTGRGRLALVHRHKDRQLLEPLLAQEARNLVIEVVEARLPVHHEHGRARLSECDGGLLSDLVEEERLFVIVEDQATSVNHVKNLAAPFGRQVGAVARDADLVVHDGASVVGAAYPVREHRLADVGPAEDRHDRPLRPLPPPRDGLPGALVGLLLHRHGAANRRRSRAVVLVILEVRPPRRALVHPGLVVEGAVSAPRRAVRRGLGSFQALAIVPNRVEVNRRGHRHAAAACTTAFAKAHFHFCVHIAIARNPRDRARRRRTGMEPDRPHIERTNANRARETP